MRAVSTVYIALPCHFICRLSLGPRTRGVEEIPHTFSSYTGWVFQVRPMPLQYVSPPRVLEQVLTVVCYVAGLGIVESDCRSVFPSRRSSLNPSLTGTRTFVPFLSPGGHWCQRAYCRKAHVTSVRRKFCCRVVREREHRVNALVAAVLTR